jgi:hypothetical protein
MSPGDSNEPTTSPLEGVPPMPLPKKGERKLVGFRFAKSIDLEAEAKKAGYDGVSQFVADTMYLRLGRKELMEGPRTNGGETDQLSLIA